MLYVHTNTSLGSLLTYYGLCNTLNEHVSGFKKILDNDDHAPLPEIYSNLLFFSREISWADYNYFDIFT